MIPVRVISPAVRNPLDSTYYEIAVNFFASVFNYYIVSRHFADFGDARVYSVGLHVFVVVY